MFDPKDFVELCNDLMRFSTSFSEAINRTIAGRAYYGSFLLTREKVRALCRGSAVERQYNLLCDDPRAGGLIHEAVIRITKQIDPFAGDLLLSLRKRRNRADYDLTPFRMIEARDAIDDADDYIRGIVTSFRNFNVYYRLVERIILEVYSKI